MKIDTQDIVADPESYKEYIDRNKKIQKNNERIKEVNYSRNSGNKNNYDYTEHKLINRNIIRNNNIFNQKKKRECKSLDMKKIQKGNKNMLYTKCKITDIKNEDIYSLIYKENKEKLEHRINEGFSEYENKNIFDGKIQIEFKEALDTIHQKLIIIKFFKIN